MAKKTNKTDHVLNLISSGEEKHSGTSAGETKSDSTPPPVDPTANHNTQVDTQASNTSQVSIVHSSTKDDQVVANTIKNSLEEELEKAAPLREEGVIPKKKMTAREAYGVPEAAKVINEEVEDEPIQSITEAAVKEIKEVHAKEQEFADEEPEMEEENVPKVEDVYEDRFRKDLEQRLKEPSPDYTFVNVMEYLVRDKVIGYMEQFGNCTCSRCIEDTSALTLTHLPAKYVVVNKAAISPLLDYYGHNYAGQITVEITKACIRVGNQPHHNRE